MEVSEEQVCGNIDDCGPDACRTESCADEAKDYTCDCDEDCELMLLVHRPACLAKECAIFFSRTVPWSRRGWERESVMMLWQL